MPKRKGIDLVTVKRESHGVLTVEMIQRAKERLLANEATINECFVAMYGEEALQMQPQYTDSVLIPLNTKPGRVAARKYAELTNDQLLMDKIDALDKEDDEATRRLRDEKHSRP